MKTMTTLEGIKELAGYEVCEIFESDPIGSIYKNAFIVIDHQTREITFQLQSDAISLVGINGCQYPAMIEAAKIIIERFNKTFPCRENSIAITKLDEALMWINKRTEDRIKRDVEGKLEA